MLRAAAADLEALARVQDVLQRHLEKFGARKELVVTWGPPVEDDDGAAAAASSMDEGS